MEVKRIGNIYGEDKGTGFAGNVWDKEGLSPTITTMQGGGREPMIIEETKCVGGSYKYCVAMRGRGENNEQQLEPNRQGVDNSLTTVQKDNLVMESPNYRIRKLTPKECWRLMGFSDEDFGKAEKVCSSTQLYKQAGNSIVVNVLMAIFSQMNIKGVKPWNEVHNEKK